MNGLINGTGQGYQRLYEVNPYLSELKEEIMRVEERINDAFYTNLFMLVTQISDQPNITATQINTMREEKLMMLGPVLERLNDELLDPLIDRAFAIALKFNLLPPPPEGIAGMDLRIEYISIMAQAQKAMAVGNIERFTGYLANVAGFKPEAIDRFDVDAAIEEYADAVAVPPKLVVPLELAQQGRAQRAEAEQQAVATQGAMQAADMATKAAGVESKDNSVLSQALQIAGVV